MSAQPHSKTIVVGYDGSPAARAAVELAIDRAGPAGRVIVVNAFEVPADFIGAGSSAYMREDVAQHAREVMDALERDCERLATVDYTRELVLGRPAPSIAGAAETHEADEIVMGSRGVGRVRALVGSVAHDVIHQAHCPVTVIPERMVELHTETAARPCAGHRLSRPLHGRSSWAGRNRDAPVSDPA
jgi:nucleotide-binding universal stress UspA family protein